MVMTSEERKEKYNSIISNLNSDLADLINRSKEEIKDNVENTNPILSDTLPPCGSMYKNQEIPNTDLTAEEIESLQMDAQEEVNDILDELTAENIDDELNEMAKQAKSPGPGTGKGDMEGYIHIPKYVVPEWFDEIEAAVGSLIGAPEKGRRGTDYEEMQTYIEQGVMIVRRPKAMIIEEDKEIYVLLDQSGSMGQGTFKGISILKLLGGFIPLLGEEYSGEYWMCDDCSFNDYRKDPSSVPNKRVPLESVSENLIVSGGGGTAFAGAFAKLGQIEKNKQEENPDYEMCVIFFSDMEVSSEIDLYEELGPSKIIFVTDTKHQQELKEQDWIINSEKHKIVIINMENTATDE